MIPAFSKAQIRIMKAFKKRADIRSRLVPLDNGDRDFQCFAVDKTTHKETLLFRSLQSELLVP